MIYITGDLHGNIDVSKLNGKNWPEGKELSKSDFLIVVGDFGFIWSDEPDDFEEWWLNWFEEKPWTTLFIDGNHENHNRLRDLPIVSKFNSKVGKGNDSVFHLKRGHIYEIEGYTFFAFGGARSSDREFRKDQVSWWSEEIPSEEEFELGKSNLFERNHKVDYLLFHTLPLSIAPQFNLALKQDIIDDPTCKMLDFFTSKVSFKRGFSGHIHKDLDSDNWSILFDRVIAITEANKGQSKTSFTD